MVEKIIAKIMPNCNRRNQKGRSYGNVYVSLALEIYQRGCAKPNNDVLRFLERYKDNLFNNLEESEFQYLIEHKEEVIDYVCDCQKHPLLEGRWLYMTPLTISKLCVELAQVKDGDKVYLPFLGLGSFADNLPAKCVIEGEEYDGVVWALEKIREWSKGVEYNGLVCADSYKHMADSTNEGRYDVIIMAPPYGFNSMSKWGDDIAEALDKSLNVLTNNGRIVMFGPQDFNTNKKFEDLRARLLQEAMVEMVVSLGEGLLMPTTGAAACIWIVSKHDNESVTFIDATKCTLPRDGKRYVTLDASLALSIIKAVRSESKTIVASRDIDPMFLMPEKTKTAFLQMNNLVDMQVLWLDDDPGIVESFSNLAKEKGIQIKHFESWDECEDVFKRHIHQWDAIILDANCKFHANDTKYSATSFVNATISRIERICYENKINTIPWYVLTEGKISTIRFLNSCLRNIDRLWPDGLNGKNYYLKNEKDEVLLLDVIKHQCNRSVQYEVYIKYNEVFQAIDYCGLSVAVRQYMLDLLCPMYDGTTATNYNHRFNDARKTIEAIFTDMINRGFLPNSLRTSNKKGANLSWCSKILAGEEDIISQDNNLVARNITKDICKGFGAYQKLMAYNVKSIIYAAGSNEHDQQIMSDEGRRTVNTDAYLKDVNHSSFLIQSYALQLCDFILWYKQFITKNK